MEKTLNNTNQSDAQRTSGDLVVFGNTDTWVLICKASSRAEGWMKSTKAMDIPGSGVVVQITTQQRNPDGSYAISDCAVFVRGTRIVVKDGVPIIEGYPTRKDNNNG